MNSGLQNILKISSIIVLLAGFASCKDNNDAMEEPQTAQFKVTIQNTSASYDYVKSGTFAMPIGDSEAGPIPPGKSYEFEFTAPVGAHLSFATMFGQSNDWFYAPGESGLALYNEDGSQVTGDVTSSIHLYDAGTEEDQEPGVGSNQAPRQSAPNTGPADDNTQVREVMDSGIPATEDVMKVTLASTGTYGFKVTIENISTATSLQTSEGGKPMVFSPGVWVVNSADQMPMFTEGEADRGEGLERIAEDGNPEDLSASVMEKTGLNVLLSPGAFAVYKEDNPIFMSGEEAPDNGIEGIAEDGAAADLAAFLDADTDLSASGAFTKGVGASQDGPIGPGGSYTFTFSAEDGDKLTFATMFAQSNDWFYAPEGIELFSAGSPVTGDVSDQIKLWDAGTEMNEEPGIGSNQAPRQSAPNTGPADDNTTVREADSTYGSGAVTITLEMVQ